MEAPNLSNIFRSRPFLEGLYFCRVNMDPFLFTTKPKKITLSTQKVHFSLFCKQTIYPKDGKDRPQMVYVLM